MIERIGLVNFLEGIGVDVDPNMISQPAPELLHPHGRVGRRGREVVRPQGRAETGRGRLRRHPHQYAADNDGACTQWHAPPSDEPKNTICWRLPWLKHPRRNAYADRIRLPGSVPVYAPPDDQELWHVEISRASPSRRTAPRRQVRRQLWTVRAGTQRILDVFTLRKLCDIGDKFAEGYRALHHPLQHRIHGQQTKPRSSR